jgi:hypothetical protein
MSEPIPEHRQEAATPFDTGKASGPPQSLLPTADPGLPQTSGPQEMPDQIQADAARSLLAIQKVLRTGCLPALIEIRDALQDIARTHRDVLELQRGIILADQKEIEQIRAVLHGPPGRKDNPGRRTTSQTRW